MINYELWLGDQAGSRLQSLGNFINLTWVRALNDVGGFSVLFDERDFPVTYYQRDRRIEIWRQAGNFPQSLIMIGFLRVKQRYYLGDRPYIQLAGVDQVELLKRRIIAAFASSTGAVKTDYADDMMKAYVTEQLGSGAGTGRDISSIFSIDADQSLGPSIKQSQPRANLLYALQDISRSAAEAGAQVYFDVIPASTTSFVFSTFVGQRGIDRTYTGFSPFTFSVQRGNLANPVLLEDATEEVNYVYAGGEGTKLSREIATASDTGRAGVSLVGRREAFYDGRMYSGNSLTAAANARLRAGRPKTLFNGELLDVEGSLFGVHWGFGDKVTAEMPPDRIDAIVQTVRADVNELGFEQISGRLWYADE